MMSPTLPLFLAIIWLSLGGSFEAEPEVTFASTVTSLELGKSAKLSCQLNFSMENFLPERDNFAVIFYRESDYFFHYYISAADSSGHRTTKFEDYPPRQPSLARHPLSSSFPIYEITITPTLASTADYSCRLYQSSASGNVLSNNLSITVTPPHLPPPPPSVILSSNVISPLPAHPFTLSCTFAHFTAPPVNYSVQFGSSRDGQLAVYDVVNGKSLLDDDINGKVDVSHGHRSTYPNFDLIITEKGNISSEYWCAIEEKGKAPVVSNTWPIKVHFTGSKPAENQRAATCSVVGATGLEPRGKPYTVQFVSDAGPKAVNLLGEYIFKPAFGQEFKVAHVTSWGAIHYGASASWPNFSILANGTGSLQGHGTWWCVLAVGAQGTPDYREITSDKATL